MTVVNKVSNGSYQLTLSGSGNMVFAGGIGNGSGGVTKSGSGMATLLASGGTTGARHPVAVHRRCERDRRHAADRERQFAVQ